MVSFKEIGTRIRTLRKQRRMTQEELGMKTGYTSRSSIAKIEAGIIDFPYSKVEAFAKALDATPADLLGVSAAVEIAEPREKMSVIEGSYLFKKENDALSDIILKLRSNADFFETAVTLSKLDAEKLAAVKALLCTFAGDGK